MRRSGVLYASLAGLVVTHVGGAIALGTPPDTNDDGATVAAWFRDNGSHVRWWLWFGTISLILLGVFVACVRARLPELYRDVFFVGAIALVAESAVQSWIWAGLALHGKDLEPATARTVLDVSSY